MDLIYCNENKEELGVLKDYSFDLAFGSGENDFELTMPLVNNICNEDYHIYVDGTEFGGIIDKIMIDTAAKQIKYCGRTYHGIIDNKIIRPNNGQNYYTVSGDANTIISTLISRLGLGSLFVADTNSSVNISSYQFTRYVSAYEGIRKMLDSVGYKLSMVHENGMVKLSAKPIVNYDDEGLDSDRISFQITKEFNKVNHLVCLGQGELANRTVVDLYLDRNGNITTSKVFTGIEEIEKKFDYPNAESTEDLTKSGKEKLLEYNADAVDISLDETFNFDIGDRITATDINTGITVNKAIVKKIVTIKKNIYKVEYKVGD